MAYGMAMKVYTTVSGRRASTDIKACETAGLVEKAPRYNTIFDYFNKPSMTPLPGQLARVELALALLHHVVARRGDDRGLRWRRLLLLHRRHGP
jgi:hypothetical protein